MTVSRRLIALVCAVAVTAGAAVAVAGVAAPAVAVAAGNPILNECKSGSLTHPYTVGQLRHALDVLPAELKQYSSCYDVIQSALVSARRHNGKLPVQSGSASGGGGSFLPTPVIIILVILILAAVTFGALAVRRRRGGDDERS